MNSNDVFDNWVSMQEALQYIAFRTFEPISAEQAIKNKDKISDAEKNLCYAIQNGFLKIMADIYVPGDGYYAAKNQLIMQIDSNAIIVSADNEIRIYRRTLENVRISEFDLLHNFPPKSIKNRDRPKRLTDKQVKAFFNALKRANYSQKGDIKLVWAQEILEESTHIVNCPINTLREYLKQYSNFSDTKN